MAKNTKIATPFTKGPMKGPKKGGGKKMAAKRY